MKCRACGEELGVLNEEDRLCVNAADFQNSCWTRFWRFAREQQLPNWRDSDNPNFDFSKSEVVVAYDMWVEAGMP